MRDALIAFATAATTLMGPLAALADDYRPPNRKPGLWRVTTKVNKTRPTHIQVCVDPATDWATLPRGLVSSKCEQISVSRNGDDIEVGATCEFGEMVQKSVYTVSGDFQSSYAIRFVNDTTSPKKDTPQHSEGIQSGTWAGPCPADLKPGYALMPGGWKLDMAKTFTE